MAEAIYQEYEDLLEGGSNKVAARKALASKHKITIIQTKVITSKATYRSHGKLETQRRRTMTINGYHKVIQAGQKPTAINIKKHLEKTVGISLGKTAIRQHLIAAGSVEKNQVASKNSDTRNKRKRESDDSDDDTSRDIEQTSATQVDVKHAFQACAKKQLGTKCQVVTLREGQKNVP